MRIGTLGDALEIQLLDILWLDSQAEASSAPGGRVKSLVRGANGHVDFRSARERNRSKRLVAVVASCSHVRPLYERRRIEAHPTLLQRDPFLRGSPK